MELAYKDSKSMTAATKSTDQWAFCNSIIATILTSPPPGTTFACYAYAPMAYGPNTRTKFIIGVASITKEWTVASQSFVVKKFNDMASLTFFLSIMDPLQKTGVVGAKMITK